MSKKYICLCTKNLNDGIGDSIHLLKYCDYFEKNKESFGMGDYTLIILLYFGNMDKKIDIIYDKAYTMGFVEKIDYKIYDDNDDKSDNDKSDDDKSGDDETNYKKKDDKKNKQFKCIDKVNNLNIKKHFLILLRDMPIVNLEYCNYYIDNISNIIFMCNISYLLFFDTYKENDNLYYKFSSHAEKLNKLFKYYFLGELVASPNDSTSAYDSNMPINMIYKMGLICNPKNSNYYSYDKCAGLPLNNLDFKTDINNKNNKAELLQEITNKEFINIILKKHNIDITNIDGCINFFEKNEIILAYIQNYNGHSMCSDTLLCSYIKKIRDSSLYNNKNIIIVSNIKLKPINMTDEINYISETYKANTNKSNDLLRKLIDERFQYSYIDDSTIEIHKIYFEDNDYNILNKISFGFQICSGDNSILEAMENGRIPLILYRHDKEQILTEFNTYINSNIYFKINHGTLKLYLNYFNQKLIQIPDYQYYELFNTYEMTDICNELDSELFKKDIDMMKANNHDKNSIQYKERYAIYKEMNDIIKNNSDELLQQYQSMIKYIYLNDNSFTWLLQTIKKSILASYKKFILF